MPYKVTLKNRTPFGNAGEEVILDKEIIEAYGDEYFENVEEVKVEADENDIDALTAKEITARLEALGVEIPKRSSKSDLVALLKEVTTSKEESNEVGNEKTTESTAIISAENTAIQSPNEMK